MESTNDIVFSFDTTGSMYPCLSGIKSNMKVILEQLFNNIPGLRIGIIAHGDYCDERSTYLVKSIELTNDKAALVNFVNNVGSTGGCGGGAAYDYVMLKTNEMNWESNKMRALVMIGDEVPDEPNDPHNKYKVDWRAECKKLFEKNINIYSIHCLDWGRPNVTKFYKYLATNTNGYYLNLSQFSNIKNILTAVCYKQQDDEAVKRYEDQLRRETSGMTKNLQVMFDTILNRPIQDQGYQPQPDSESDSDSDHPVFPCNPAKFQVFDVDEKISIKDFVNKLGLTFKTGKGFYEFTKSESISDGKEIILMEKATGNLYEGRGARKLANLNKHAGKAKIKPSDIPNYRVFVQSTSISRLLVPGTGFLYEVLL
jgi:hypothetical protein